MLLKIAVVGIGVAGAYLMNRLQDQHDIKVVGYERMPEKDHDAVCAWATCENEMYGLVKNCGLNFDDYILHSGRTMKVEGDNAVSIDIGLKGMVSYDKLKLIQDMIKGTEIKFGQSPRKDSLESDYDIIIDSTGFHRNYLPRLASEMWIPCIQYKVKYAEGKCPFDDFYLKAFPSMSGYFWYFPLGNNYAHIGAGDFDRKQNEFVQSFIKKNDCQIIKKVGRPIRISPPMYCEPFTDGRKTVGVGESIGTVYPLLGEGIIPSTWCADIFINNLGNLELYRKEVLRKFEIYALVYKFIKMKIEGKFTLIRNLYDLLRIYRHMKSQEERYGMEVKMIDMLKVCKI